MKNIQNIKVSIEKVRKELDALILTEKFECYYEKSKELDALIEEYLDAYEASVQENVVLA